MSAEIKPVKRRQNAACDACKLRRVKCDLSEQRVGVEDITLAICTPCATKNICCTTVRNQTRPPPRRTGARIEAAKRQHGELIPTQEHPESSTAWLVSQASTPGEASDAYSSAFLDCLASSGAPSQGFGSTPYSFDFSALSEASTPLSVQSHKRQRLGTTIADTNLWGKTVSTQLSRILIREYFDSVHHQIPAIDPEDFLFRFQQADETPELMGASEATCAMLECWGARYSMHPVVLGTIPDDSIGDITSGTHSRLKWGLAREPICRALLGRGRELMDKHGVLRKPSLEGLQAMFLLQTMLNSAMDVGDIDRMIMLELRALHSAIAAHCDALNLKAVAKAENTSPDGEMGAFLFALNSPALRVYRTAWINDAMTAASGRMLPAMPENEITPPFDSLTRPQGSGALTAHQEMASLRAFLTTMISVSSIARSVAVNISHPASVPGAVDIARLCRDVGKVWDDLDSVSRIIRSTVRHVSRASGYLPQFSPLNWLVNVRSCMTYVIVIVHVAVEEQRDFQRRLRTQSGSLRDLSDSSPAGLAPNVELVDQLHAESVEKTLVACRDYALLIKSILGTDLVAHAGVVLRGLAHVALSLAGFECREHDDRTAVLSRTWTWQEKKTEVGWCLEGLYQMGWAWGDMTAIVKLIQDKLAAEASGRTAAEVREEPPFTPSEVPVKLQHYETSAFLAAYPPPQVIPHFTGTPATEAAMLAPF